MYFYGMNQQQQWQKEAEAIKLLVETFNCKDTRAQASLGCDIILNGKFYDIKSSTSQKLTVLKKLGSGPKAGTTYCPLLEHTDIDYMYMIERQEYYLVFIMRKLDIIDYIIRNAETLQWSHYNGDGNENLTVKLKLSDFDLIAYDNFKLNKEINR